MEEERVVEHHYDRRGRVSKTIYPSTSDQVEYTYTPRSEVDKIYWKGQEIENRGYNSLGQMDSTERQWDTTPVIETRDYERRRLTAISNPVVGTFAYQYDANHNKVSEAVAGKQHWNHFRSIPTLIQVPMVTMRKIVLAGTPELQIQTQFNTSGMLTMSVTHQLATLFRSELPIRHLRLALFYPTVCINFKILVCQTV